jgi:hypothetical protein
MFRSRQGDGPRRGLSVRASLMKDDAHWPFAEGDIELSQTDEHIGRSPIEPVSGISSFEQTAATNVVGLVGARTHNADYKSTVGA